MVGFLLFWDLFVVSRYSPKRPQGQELNKPSTMSEHVMTPSSKNLSAVSQPTSIRKTIELKSPHDHISFDTQGAGITTWLIYEKDHWLELFPGDKNSGFSALQTFPELNFSLAEQSPTHVRFFAQHPNGFDVSKTITLLGQKPFHTVSLVITNPTQAPISIDASLSWSGGLTRRPMDPNKKFDQESAVKSEMRVVASGNRVYSYHPGLIFGRTVDTQLPDGVDWIGVDNHHFLAALIHPVQPIERARVQVSRSTLPRFFIPIQKTLQSGESLQHTYLLYVGPKSYSELSQWPYNISKAVNFGMFGVIAKALLHALNSLYSMTGNYGWAIIILTIGVQLLVFPLTRKSLKYSARMKELQPQIKALQDQFRKDPKRLQIETYNLYKKNGLKLMGMEGCLPMLLQMPVFFAFYATMQAAYELRGAPWIFWIHDLGSKDPYFLLPILMGVGMFVQQKLSAVAADPAQARIMMLMPVMFTFMFANLPSGLVLYWFTNSLMSILMQQIFMWSSKSRRPEAPTP